MKRVRGCTATPEEKARMKAMAMSAMQAEGWSLRQIGRFFGVSHTEADRMIRRVTLGTPVITGLGCEYRVIPGVSDPV